MLVLSRKESERIRVGDSIVVTVVRLTKDRVRLGIEAPEDVLVLRDELEKEDDVMSVPEIRTIPARRPAPGPCALARKMSGTIVRKESAGGGVALEEKPMEETEQGVATKRRCPDRKYFRYEN